MAGLSRRDLLKLFGLGGVVGAAALYFPGSVQAAVNGGQMYTDAGIKLFQDLFAGTDSTKNVIFSPAAAHGAFLQMAPGVRGASAKAFQNIYGNDLHGAAVAFSKICDDIMPSQGSQADVLVNAEMYISDKCGINPEFLRGYEADFGEGMKPSIIDFSQAAATETVNKFARDTTRGRVDKLYDQVPTNTGLIGLGTMYFKAPWVNKFDPAKTTPGDFNANGRIIKVPMMNQKTNAAYVRSEKYAFEYAAIPFVDNYQFFAIKPIGNRTLADTVRELGPILQAVQDVGEQSVHLSIPRMELTDKANVTEAFKKGVLGPIFARDAASDFNNIALGVGAVSEVRQGIGLIINEEGGEAYAAFGVGTTRGISNDPVFALDCPSVVGIQCTRPGARVPLIFAALRNPALRS